MSQPASKGALRKAFSPEARLRNTCQTGKHARSHARIAIYALIAIGLFPLASGCKPENMADLSCEVLVVGGGASGSCAGIQAARLGAHTLIVEEHPWLGGMLSAAGVSAIDGNYRLPSGLWEEFRQKLYQHYGGKDGVKTGWVSNVLFEPYVGDSILKALASREPMLKVRYGNYPVSIEKQGNGWLVGFQSTDGASSLTVRANVVVDATELGDLSKMAGIPYRIGMDAKSLTGESVALDKARDIIQDLTYVATLKDYGPGADMTISRPEGYRPEEFYATCAGRVDSSDRTLWTQEKMMAYGKLPNGKYMINWPIYGNDYYLNIIEMSREERIRALEAAKQHTLRYIYYLQTELGYHRLGLADDEFPTPDRLPFIPYHRESRRTIGEAFFTLEHIAAPYDQDEKLYRTGIAVGDYPVDHHHSAYSLDHVFPELQYYPVPSFALPLGTLIPKGTDNFIVAEKSISVSNIVNGTTRLQPVCLLIGQAAGVVAAQAVREGKTPADLSVRDIQNTLLQASAYILPYIDVQPDDPWFTATQKIGASGILRSEGRNRGWANETWFYPDSMLTVAELREGLANFFDGTEAATPETFLSNDTYPYVSLKQARELITFISEREKPGLSEAAIAEKLAHALHVAQASDLNQNDLLDRKTFCLLFDEVLDVFGLREVDLHGRILPTR